MMALNNTSATTNGNAYTSLPIYRERNKQDGRIIINPDYLTKTKQFYADYYTLNTNSDSAGSYSNTVNQFRDIYNSYVFNKPSDIKDSELYRLNTLIQNYSTVDDAINTPLRPSSFSTEHIAIKDDPLNLRSKDSLLAPNKLKPKFASFEEANNFFTSDKSIFTYLENTPVTQAQAIKQANSYRESAMQQKAADIYNDANNLVLESYTKIQAHSLDSKRSELTFYSPDNVNRLRQTVFDDYNRLHNYYKNTLGEYDKNKLTISKHLMEQETTFSDYLEAVNGLNTIEEADAYARNAAASAADKARADFLSSPDATYRIPRKDLTESDKELVKSFMYDSDGKRIKVSKLRNAINLKDAYKNRADKYQNETYQDTVLRLANDITSYDNDKRAEAVADIGASLYKKALKRRPDLQDELGLIYKYPHLNPKSDTITQSARRLANKHTYSGVPDNEFAPYTFDRNYVREWLGDSSEKFHGNQDYKLFDKLELRDKDVLNIADIEHIIHEQSQAQNKESVMAETVFKAMFDANYSNKDGESALVPFIGPSLIDSANHQGIEYYANGDYLSVESLADKVFNAYQEAGLFIPVTKDTLTDKQRDEINALHYRISGYRPVRGISGPQTAYTGVIPVAETLSDNQIANIINSRQREEIADYLLNNVLVKDEDRLSDFNNWYRGQYSANDYARNASDSAIRYKQIQKFNSLLRNDNDGSLDSDLIAIAENYELIANPPRGKGDIKPHRFTDQSIVRDMTFESDNKQDIINNFIDSINELSTGRTKAYSYKDDAILNNIRIGGEPNTVNTNNVITKHIETLNKQLGRYKQWGDIYTAKSVDSIAPKSYHYNKINKELISRDVPLLKTAYKDIFDNTKGKDIKVAYTTLSSNERKDYESLFDTIKYLQDKEKNSMQYTINNITAAMQNDPSIIPAQHKDDPYYKQLIENLQDVMSAVPESMIEHTGFPKTTEETKLIPDAADNTRQLIQDDEQILRMEQSRQTVKSTEITPLVDKKMQNVTNAATGTYMQTIRKLPDQRYSLFTPDGFEIDNYKSRDFGSQGRLTYNEWLHNSVILGHNINSEGIPEGAIKYGAMDFDEYYKPYAFLGDAKVYNKEQGKYITRTEDAKLMPDKYITVKPLTEEGIFSKQGKTLPITLDELSAGKINLKKHGYNEWYEYDITQFDDFNNNMASIINMLEEKNNRRTSGLYYDTLTNLKSAINVDYTMKGKELQNAYDKVIKTKYADIANQRDKAIGKSISYTAISGAEHDDLGNLIHIMRREAPEEIYTAINKIANIPGRDDNTAYGNLGSAANASVYVRFNEPGESANIWLRPMPVKPGSNWAQFQTLGVMVNDTSIDYSGDPIKLITTMTDVYKQRDDIANYYTGPSLDLVKQTNDAMAKLRSNVRELDFNGVVRTPMEIYESVYKNANNYTKVQHGDMSKRSQQFVSSIIEDTVNANAIQYMTIDPRTKLKEAGLMETALINAINDLKQDDIEHALSLRMSSHDMATGWESIYNDKTLESTNDIILELTRRKVQQNAVKHIQTQYFSDQSGNAAQAYVRRAMDEVPGIEQLDSNDMVDNVMAWLKAAEYRVREDLGNNNYTHNTLKELAANRNTIMQHMRAISAGKEASLDALTEEGAFAVFKDKYIKQVFKEGEHESDYIIAMDELVDVQDKAISLSVDAQEQFIHNATERVRDTASKFADFLNNDAVSAEKDLLKSKSITRDDVITKSANYQAKMRQWHENRNSYNIKSTVSDLFEETYLLSPQQYKDIRDIYMQGNMTDNEYISEINNRIIRPITYDNNDPIGRYADQLISKNKGRYSALGKRLKLDKEGMRDYVIGKVKEDADLSESIIESANIRHKWLEKHITANKSRQNIKINKYKNLMDNLITDIDEKEQTVTKTIQALRINDEEQIKRVYKLMIENKNPFEQNTDSFKLIHDIAQMDSDFRISGEYRNPYTNKLSLWTQRDIVNLDNGIGIHDTETGITFQIFDKDEDAKVIRNVFELSNKVMTPELHSVTRNMTYSPITDKDGGNTLLVNQHINMGDILTPHTHSAKNRFLSKSVESEGLPQMGLTDSLSKFKNIADLALAGKPASLTVIDYETSTLPSLLNQDNAYLFRPIQVAGRKFDISHDGSKFNYTASDVLENFFVRSRYEGDIDPMLKYWEDIGKANFIKLNREELRLDNLEFGIARDYAKFNIGKGDEIFNELIQMGFKSDKDKKLISINDAFRTGSYKGMSREKFLDTLYVRAEQAMQYLDMNQAYNLDSKALKRLEANMPRDKVLDFDDAMAKIHNLTQDKNSPVVAYNLSGAEHPWTQLMMDNSKLSGAKKRQTVEAFETGIDAMYIGRGLRSERTSHALSELVDYNAYNLQAHKADADIEATVIMLTETLNKHIGGKKAYEHYLGSDALEIGSILAKTSTSETDFYRGLDISKGMYIVTGLNDITVQLPNTKQLVNQTELAIRPIDLTKINTDTEHIFGETRKIVMANKEELMFELNANMRHLGNVTLSGEPNISEITKTLPDLNKTFNSLINDDIERTLHNAARGGYDALSLYVQQSSGDNIHENMLYTLRDALVESQDAMQYIQEEVRANGVKAIKFKSTNSDLLAVALENINVLTGKNFIDETTKANSNQSDLYRAGKDVIRQWAFGKSDNNTQFTKEFKTVLDILQDTKALKQMGYIDHGIEALTNERVMKLLTETKKQAGLTKTLEDAYTFTIHTSGIAGETVKHNLRLDISNMTELTTRIKNMGRTLERDGVEDSINNVIMPQLMDILNDAGVKLPMGDGQIGATISNKLYKDYNPVNQMAEFLLANKQAIRTAKSGALKDRFAKSVVADMSNTLKGEELDKFVANAQSIHEELITKIVGTNRANLTEEQLNRLKTSLTERLALNRNITKDAGRVIGAAVAERTGDDPNNLALSLAAFLKTDTALTDQASQLFTEFGQYDKNLDERIRRGQSVYYNAINNKYTNYGIADWQLQYMLPDEIMSRANQYSRYSNLNNINNLGGIFKSGLSVKASKEDIAKLEVLNNADLYPELQSLFKSDLYQNRATIENANQRIIDAANNIKQAVINNIETNNYRADMYYGEIGSRATMNGLKPFDIFDRNANKYTNRMFGTNNEILAALPGNTRKSMFDYIDMAYDRSASAEQLRAMKALNWIKDLDKPSFVFDPQNYNLSLDEIDTHTRALSNKAFDQLIKKTDSNGNTVFDADAYGGLVNSYQDMITNMNNILLTGRARVQDGNEFTSIAGRPLGSLSYKQVHDLLSSNNRKYLGSEANLLDFYDQVKTNYAHMTESYGVPNVAEGYGTSKAAEGVINIQAPIAPGAPSAVNAPNIVESAADVQTPVAPSVPSVAGAPSNVSVPVGVPPVASISASAPTGAPISVPPVASAPPVISRPAGTPWQTIYNEGVADSYNMFRNQAQQAQISMAKSGNLVYNGLDNSIADIVVQASAPAPISESPGSAYVDGLMRGFVGDESADSVKQIAETAKHTATSVKHKIKNITSDPAARQAAALIGVGAGALAFAGLLLKQHTAKSDRHTPESVKRKDEAPLPDSTYEDKYNGTPHQTMTPQQTIRLEEHGRGMNINIKARSKYISNKSDIETMLSSAFEGSRVGTNININHTDDRTSMNRDYVSHLFSKAIAGN